MRELKFRAFDTENKTWTFVTLGDLICGACTENGDKPLSGAKQVWEQYTGLKDKNGKEIYEGDIVERKKLILAREMAIPGWGKDHTDVRRATIVFENGSFYGRSVEAGLNFEYSWDELEEFFEIIGNIHENPELLEEEKCES